MPDRSASSYEKTLGERLRREAMESRPEFSEWLHAQICRALSDRRSPAVPGGPREDGPRARSGSGGRFGIRRSHGAALAAAAACVVGVAAIVWQAAPWNRSSDMADLPGAGVRARPGEETPAADWLELGSHLYAFSGLSDRMSGPIGDWTQSAVAVQRWAYLDHDAQLTVRMLADRLPFDVGSSLAWSPAE